MIRHINPTANKPETPYLSDPKQPVFSEKNKLHPAYNPKSRIFYHNLFALGDILHYHAIMEKTATGELNKKAFRRLKETETLYKLIHKYKLREEAYKTVLKIYIKTKEEK